MMLAVQTDLPRVLLMDTLRTLILDLALMAILRVLS